MIRLGGAKSQPLGLAIASTKASRSGSATSIRLAPASVRNPPKASGTSSSSSGLALTRIVGVTARVITGSPISAAPTAPVNAKARPTIFRGRSGSSTKQAIRAVFPGRACRASHLRIAIGSRTQRSVPGLVPLVAAYLRSQVGPAGDRQSSASSGPAAPTPARSKAPGDGRRAAAQPHAGSVEPPLFSRFGLACSRGARPVAHPASTSHVDIACVDVLKTGSGSIVQHRVYHQQLIHALLSMRPVSNLIRLQKRNSHRVDCVSRYQHGLRRVLHDLYAVKLAVNFEYTTVDVACGCDYQHRY